MRKIVTPIIVLVIIICIIFSVTSCMSTTDMRNQLFDAIENNDLDTVNTILDKYPSLINAEKVGLIKYLLGAPTGTPLLEAIRLNNFELVKLLVDRGANVNLCANSAPLISAIEGNHFDIAWFLIENGADISIIDRSPWEKNVLFTIISWKIDEHDFNDHDIEIERFKLFKYVLEQGISLDPPIGKPDGIYNILGLAAYKNHSLATKYLLDEAIVEIDVIVNDSNKTSLICAVENQSYATCRILLDYGADRTLKDANGKTAMDYAIELNDEKLISMLSE